MSVACCSLRYSASRFLILLTSALAGCGGAGELTGTVTYQGKIVSGGSVIVLGSDSLPYSGTIEDDGTYIVGGVPTGLAKITVVSLDPRLVMQLALARRTAMKAPAEVSPPPRSDTRKWFPIPKKYEAFDESGLTLTVSSGLNPHDIALD